MTIVNETDITGRHPDDVGDGSLPESVDMHSVNVPGVRFIKDLTLKVIPDSLEDLKRDHPAIGKVMEELNDKGKIVVPVIAIGGVFLFVAAKYDLLGDLADSKLLEKYRETDRKVQENIRKKIRRKPQE